MTITPIDRPRTLNSQRVNGYLCEKCGRVTWTVDVDEGTTPMFMRCKVVSGCLGTATSLFYDVPDDHPAASWEWYKPSKAIARRQDKRFPGSLEHWRKGGLSLRPARVVGAPASAEGAEAL